MAIFFSEDITICFCFCFSLYLRKNRNNMIYEDFREAFIDQVCFTSNQVYAWYPGFDKNNLSRWLKKNYLIKLRNGFYMFRELSDTPNINYYVSNRIYLPSYISLQAALAFYGFIPEAIINITGVSTRKTAIFTNELGSFTYNKLSEKLFFGFDYKPFLKDKTILMASPEKALLDLLYLNAFYISEKDMLDLRLDNDMIKDAINKNKLLEMLNYFENKALERRVDRVLKLYEL